VAKVVMSDGTPAWMLTRYDDVKATLADNRFSTSPKQPGYPFLSPSRAAQLIHEDPAALIRLDAPEHNRQRRMFTKEFMHASVQKMRPFIQQTVDDLIDHLERTGPPCNFVEDFALALPSTVIATLLGVPLEDNEYFQERAQAKLDLAADPEVPLRAGREMREYLDALMTAKMADLDAHDDLISRFIADQLLPGHMTREQALITIELLLMGGHETTANMIALGTLSLLLHPDQRDALVADPSLVGAAIEEMLRFHTIIHYNGARVALEDIEVGGRTIHKGEGVLALIAAANRDPLRFPDPDAFDISREARHHLAFSYGIHQCLGQQLARLEMEIVFTTLFQRLPTLRLAVPEAELVFNFDQFVYGVQSLPLTWTTGPGSEDVTP
jgi:cytochrome P450